MSPEAADPEMITELSVAWSTSSDPWSSGSARVSHGWVTSTRSIAPRSLKTLLPRPGGLAWPGSSDRNCPYRSRLGTMIGDCGRPSGCVTATYSSRSWRTSSALSMMADLATG